MNTQELFDKMVDHLIRQNDISGQRGNCLYRGANGKMCAVGCLIDDKHYNSGFEGVDAEDVDVLQAVESSIGRPLDEKEMALLLRLQEVHDSCRIFEWPTKLRQVAEKFNLEYHGDQYGQQPVGS